MSRNIIITGVPGIGKTTLVQKLVSCLRDRELPIAGFYTEELRQSGQRVGFDIVTVDGQKASLARLSEGSDRGPKVGRFSVQLRDFEQIALPTLKPNKDKHTFYIIDEIGKMELFSAKFKELVSELFEDPDTIIIATIPVPKGKPNAFVEYVRKHPRSQVYEVTRQNRDTIVDSLKDKLT